MGKSAGDSLAVLEPGVCRICVLFQRDGAEDRPLPIELYKS